jgi:cell cycle arrest protein BUB3
VRRSCSYNTFASAGSDGTVSIWDHKLKKRLRQYPKYNDAIPSVAFNCDGTKLAVAVSYTWDEGDQGAKTAETPKIFIRTTGDEVKVSIIGFTMLTDLLTDFLSPRVGLGARRC